MILDQVVTTHDDMHKVADDMLREVGMGIGDCGGSVTFAGMEPVRKTVIKAGAAPAIILASNAVAEAAIWRERTGEGQDIHVDLRKAWIEQSPWQLDAVPYTLVNGQHKMFNLGSYVVTNPIVPSRDGRWMVMCPLYPSQERDFLRTHELRCRARADRASYDKARSFGNGSRCGGRAGPPSNDPYQSGV